MRAQMGDDTVALIEALGRLTKATTDGDTAIANAITDLLGPIPDPRPKLLALMDYVYGLCMKKTSAE
jgi:hypothetical protein